MITDEQARVLAREWIEAWNTHDLDRIMTHYADGIEFTSPFVVGLMGDAAGTVRGLGALRGYFATGLSVYPDLKFELIGVATGVDSVVLHYRSVKHLQAFEVMTLNREGKVTRVSAHYHA